MCQRKDPLSFKWTMNRFCSCKDDCNQPFLSAKQLVPLTSKKNIHLKHIEICTHVKMWPLNPSAWVVSSRLFQEFWFALFLWNLSCMSFHQHSFEANAGCKIGKEQGKGAEWATRGNMQNNDAQGEILAREEIWKEGVWAGLPNGFKLSFWK